MDVIIAYTDGSAVASGVLNGHGGFGTYFPNLFGKRKAFSLGFKDTICSESNSRKLGGEATGLFRFSICS